MPARPGARPVPTRPEQFQCSRGLVAEVRRLAGMLGVPVEEVLDGGVAGVREEAGRLLGQERAQGGGQGTGAAGQSRDLAEELCWLTAEHGLALEGTG